jgi:transposase
MMMGERQVDQGALFYEFSLEKHVPADHMLRAIDRFVDLGEVRPYLAPFYSTTGRPSVDPELLVRYDDLTGARSCSTQAVPPTNLSRSDLVPWATGGSLKWSGRWRERGGKRISWGSE